MLDIRGAEKPGVLRDRRADEQPAIGTSFDSEMLRRRIAARDQVFRGPGEIVERILLLVEHSGPVPRVAIRIAAAEVRNGKYAAQFQPDRIDGLEQVRNRGLKAAIAVKNRRMTGIERHALCGKNEHR